MKSIREPERITPVRAEADVLVAGAGPAGFMAALAAAEPRPEPIEVRCVGGPFDGLVFTTGDDVIVHRTPDADETVTYHGEFVHLDGVELDYVHQERRPKDVPIYIGATGPKMLELTGEIADGVVTTWLRQAIRERIDPMPDEDADDSSEESADESAVEVSATSTTDNNGSTAQVAEPLEHKK